MLECLCTAIHRDCVFYFRQAETDQTGCPPKLRKTWTDEGALSPLKHLQWQEFECWCRSSQSKQHYIKLASI